MILTKTKKRIFYSQIFFLMIILTSILILIDNNSKNNNSENDLINSTNISQPDFAPQTELTTLSDEISVTPLANIISPTQISRSRADEQFWATFQFDYSNIEIIYGDAVKIDFPSFTKSISNIPFQISSPITFKLLDYSFDHSIIMYQKEFAQRLFAEPGTKDYSRITVMIQLRATIKYLKTVKPTSFYPPPKIHSSIVSIQKRKKSIIKDLNNFSEFNTLLFTNKKKTVRNILINLLKRKEKQNFSLPSDILESVPYLERRVFTLTVEELNEIFIILKKRIGEDLWSNIISQDTK